MGCKGKNNKCKCKGEKKCSLPILKNKKKGGMLSSAPDLLYSIQKIQSKVALLLINVNSERDEKKQLESLRRQKLGTGDPLIYILDAKIMEKVMLITALEEKIEKEQKEIQVLQNKLGMFDDE